MHQGLWCTGSNIAWQVEGADPNHGYEATLAGDSGSGGTQGGTDSSLQAGSKAGPVGDDSLVARHLCLDALQHLSHQRSNVGLACKRSNVSKLQVLHSQPLCIDGNTKGIPVLRCIVVEVASHQSIWYHATSGKSFLSFMCILLHAQDHSCIATAGKCITASCLPPVRLVAVC